MAEFPAMRQSMRGWIEAVLGVVWRAGVVACGAGVVGCSGPTGPTGHDPIDATIAGDAPAPSDARVPVSDSCLPDPSAGHHVYACNGIDFDVEVPAACTNGGCGIILDVHGLTMSAGMEDANTELRSRGRAAGYVVVQPSAH